MKAQVARNILVVVILGIASVGACAAALTYDNSSGSQTSRLADAGNLWVGNEITLGANSSATQFMDIFAELRLNGLPNAGSDKTSYDAGIVPSGGNMLTLAVRSNSSGGGRAGGRAGVDPYNPPATEANYINYWQYNGSSWELTTNNVFGTVNFGLRIEAVPEPSVFSLFAIGGLVAFVVRHFLKRK